jgi:small-conductance mechanosensitive channel
MDLFTTLHEQYPLGETLLICVLILGITWVIEHMLYRIIRHIGRSTNNPLPASSIFANISRVCVWMIGLAWMFRVCFNYDVTGFVTALGVGGIAISLGFQDTLLNLIGGLQVSIGKLVEPGEYIEVLNQKGCVVDVSWRHTTIIDSDGNEHLVPNSLMNKNSLVNIGVSEDVRVPFLVPLETDIDRFTEDCVSALQTAFGGHLGARGIRVRFNGEEFGGLKGNIVVDAQRNVYTPEQARDAASRAIDGVLKSVGIPR